MTKRLLTAILVSLLVACGGGDDDDPSECNWVPPVVSLGGKVVTPGHCA